MKESVESEKLLERKLSNEVKKLGGWSLKLLPTFVQGLPDRICLMPGGIVFFAEIKTTGEKLRKIQSVVINKLRKLGFNVYVIDSTKQIKEVLRNYAI